MSDFFNDGAVKNRKVSRMESDERIEQLEESILTLAKANDGLHKMVVKLSNRLGVFAIIAAVDFAVLFAYLGWKHFHL